MRSWGCYWIDFCNNWCFSLFLLLFGTEDVSETKKGYENYMYYLIVTQGLESILFKVPLFKFEVLSVSIEPVPSLNCQ